MGGTLAKHSKRGMRFTLFPVHLALVAHPEIQEPREKEAQEAAKILNAKLHILDYPVLKLNKSSTEFEGILRRTINDINPYRLYVHSPFDYHQVHESVSEYYKCCKRRSTSYIL